MKCKTQFNLLIMVILASVLSLAGCADDGTNGVDGAPGTPGTAGAPGAPGAPGGNGIDVRITTFHGTGYLESTGEFDETLANPKYFANAEITSATAAVDGTVTVNFTVKDEAMDPVAGVTGVSFNIVKLVPAVFPETYNNWVPYINSTQTVSGSATGDWPNPDGTSANQASSENNGTFTDHGDGSYTYVFSTNLANVTTPVAVSYDRTLTHRISVMMGGHSGPTATATYDFIPAGGSITETREIVTTAACQSCHGSEFHGHGGNRLTVENCVSCHNPSTTDPHGGETVDLKVMIHKIHAGGELASIPGADGIVWDDPATTATDESADNGEYAIWGYRNTKHEWWKAGFPAIIENCTKCHQEPAGSGITLADVDNWKTVPSRAACGSCHDNINFAVGTNHPGGAVSNDTQCVTCHYPDTDSGFAMSVQDAHDWTQHDPRNLPEFTVDLTVTGASGSSGEFVTGDSPVVNIVIYDIADPINPIDHTTVIKDTNKESCVETDLTCVGDGLFDHIYLMVHGPRAERNPVLSTAARADVVSTIAGPYVIGATSNLTIKVDNGQDLITTDNGGTIKSGTITVSIPAASYTAAQMATLLNANANFAARAIAYVQEDSAYNDQTYAGNIAIRSRNLGKFYAIEVLSSGPAGSVLFAGGQLDTIYTVGGYYPNNDIAIKVSSNDPKATWTAGGITYTLDPVDDLKPGTYIASMEFGDMGRTNDTVYKTPTVAKTTFQVKQATEELAPAGNCGSCHQGPQGTGFVLDYPRHNKIFDNTAIDQCGGCHDYQTRDATGGWTGAVNITKRVHAVHNGANLVYPNLTVGHSDGIAGRNWEINFPQDIRNCETCHPATAATGSIATSGSWMTKAARNPCSGCHDSDAASAHFKLMTFDPTPTNPYSGDEEESCQVCH